MLFRSLSVLRSAQALSQVGEIAKGAKVVNGTTVITALLGDGISGDDLRKIALELRSKAANSVVALISVNDSKPVLVVAASDAARAGGVKAGALVKIGSTVLGAGGGFIIVPVLMIFVRLNFKKAIGTSLCIVALNSIIGFLGNLGHQDLDWMFLIGISAICGVGILLGSLLSNKISSQKLKPAFGWFTLVVGVFVLVKELFFS